MFSLLLQQFESAHSECLISQKEVHILISYYVVVSEQTQILGILNQNWTKVVFFEDVHFEKQGANILSREFNYFVILNFSN